MAVKKDFSVHKFYTYTGPNYYMDRQAIVFNLTINPSGPSADFYQEEILKKFPELEKNYPDKVADLFAAVLARIFKMDMDLFVRRVNVFTDKTDYVIALEHLDDYLAREAIYFASDWFRSMNEEISDFDFHKEFDELKEIFDGTIFGGPTIYALIEGAIKRRINVHYLYEENQFQWGYGKKQIRGRSTILHIDGIKDTEFTSYKDMVGEWLEMCGFPTPSGENCFYLDDAVAVAEKIGYPVVVKPVAGHKGIGVTTGIEDADGVRKAFSSILFSAEESGEKFEGALVQRQIYGNDHRILTVGEKFAACLKRVPAFVKGDGKSTIEELIEEENRKEIRKDNARSPLGKIKIDDDLTDYLALQNLDISSIPAENEKIELRRVANISAGGVSYNVTEKVHPANIELVENIADFLKVTILGIDVLAADISKPWTDGDFGIIEINAGPGIFMHLAPAYGGPVDVPDIIWNHLFGKTEGFDRIPIIVGNRMNSEFISNICKNLREHKKNVLAGSVRDEGVFFNDRFFTNNPRHDINCSVLLRHRSLDFAIIKHTFEKIHDYGIWHQGHDVAILEDANYAEDLVLKRDLLEDGLLIEIKTLPEQEESCEITMTRKGDKLQKRTVPKKERDLHVFKLLSPELYELLFKYDYYLKIEKSPEILETDALFVKQIKDN
ncbi:MAG: acetate--CoA ligase family protein [bacterium]